MLKLSSQLIIIILIFSSSLFSYDLKEIKQKGELRHLGMPYANFVTGSGDGLSVEVMKGFAKHLNVNYKFVPSNLEKFFGDLTGQHAKNSENGLKLLDNTPIIGDVIASGLTILNWREEVVNFSKPTFPSGVWLIARAESKLNPIKPSGDIQKDIKQVKSFIKDKTVLAIEDTCLDPRLYNLKNTNAKILLQSKEIKLNELVPAIMSRKAETTLLDVPDALVALEKWPGLIKVIGPISKKQNMAVGFRKDSPELLKEFNIYLEKIKKDGTYNDLVKKYYPDIFYYYGDFFKND
ncbi:ABC transporter substrate-binding protein [Poseidonibacter parvus]|uniref:ABC transporter substrate-binding protein n=1 Tax=Poseidonibacter parvus TaxID=1850254 RepID=A0A1P8KKL2_9BACT|nr:ABC transporter substrate-binding protein [Poseidonibacter parvus]